MKKLTLLRHAKSDWNDPVSRDFDRPLNRRGMKAARRMGEWMRSQRLDFDTVLASPALRVVETLDHLAAGLGRPMAPIFNERIYLASAVTLIDVLRESDGLGDHVLLVGHNPGLEDLVFELAGDTVDSPIADDVATKFPTGAVVEMEFPCESWSDLDGSKGHLIRFTRPRDLDPALGPDGT